MLPPCGVNVCAVKVLVDTNDLRAIAAFERMAVLLDALGAEPPLAILALRLGRGGPTAVVVACLSPRQAFREAAHQRTHHALVLQAPFADEVEFALDDRLATSADQCLAMDALSASSPPPASPAKVTVPGGVVGCISPSLLVLNVLRSPAGCKCLFGGSCSGVQATTAGRSSVCGGRGGLILCLGLLSGGCDPSLNAVVHEPPFPKGP